MGVVVSEKSAAVNRVFSDTTHFKVICHFERSEKSAFYVTN